MSREEPPERIYEPTDRLRRHIYRLPFHKQVTLFIVLGLAFGILGFIYVLIMVQLLF